MQYNKQLVQTLKVVSSINNRTQDGHVLTLWRDDNSPTPFRVSIRGAAEQYPTTVSFSTLEIANGIFNKWRTRYSLDAYTATTYTAL